MQGHAGDDPPLGRADERAPVRGDPRWKAELGDERRESAVVERPRSPVVEAGERARDPAGEGERGLRLEHLGARRVGPQGPRQQAPTELRTQRRLAHARLAQHQRSSRDGLLDALVRDGQQLRELVLPSDEDLLLARPRGPGDARPPRRRQHPSDLGIDPHPAAHRVGAGELRAALAEPGRDGVLPVAHDAHDAHVGRAGPAGLHQLLGAADREPPELREGRAARDDDAHDVVAERLRHPEAPT